MSKDSLRSVLSRLTAVDDAVAAPAPESWMQGRTLFGGFSSALLFGAAGALTPDPPPLRSALINFTGPITAPPRLTATTLRRGRNVATVEARATVDGNTAATGAFSFGKSRDAALHVANPAPEAPPPEAAEPLLPPDVSRFLPQFHQHIEIRIIAGARPFSGADEGYLRCWARHRDPASRDGAAALLCLADALPPAVYPMLTAIGPNSSMNWICNILTDDCASRGDGWFQIETRLTAANGGYSSQVMRMWDAEGRMVADGMQSVIVFA